MTEQAAQFRSLEWHVLTRLARDDFPIVPAAPGVYAVRISVRTDDSLDSIIDGYLTSSFIESVSQCDRESKSLFRRVGLANDWGWTEHERAKGRVGRIKDVHRVLSEHSPVIYVGGSKRLKDRLGELAFGGHTVNHAVWALLYAGWEMEVAWVVTEDYGDMEKSWKDSYRRSHNGKLPPLVDR